MVPIRVLPLRVVVMVDLGLAGAIDRRTGIIHHTVFSIFKAQGGGETRIQSVLT